MSASALFDEEEEERSLEPRPIHIASAQQGELDALPTLKIINGRLTQQLIQEWGQLIGDAVEIELVEQRLSRWAELLDTLPELGCYQLMEAEALGGYVVVGTSQELFFRLMERVFGGSDTPEQVSRMRLTSLEQHTARKVLGGLARACERAWKPVVRLQLVPGRMETRLQMTSAANNEEILFLASYYVRVMGEFYGQGVVLIPKSGMLRHREQLASGRYDRATVNTRQAGPTVASLVPQIKTRLHVELGRVQMTLSQMESWQVGDVIRLDQSCEEPLRVCVEGIEKFRGAPGQRHGNLAVTIADVSD